jgi:hypothetical protein
MNVADYFFPKLLVFAFTGLSWKEYFVCLFQVIKEQFGVMRHGGKEREREREKRK